MERRRKRELRDLNYRAWNGEKVSSSLDSSMKKNTAFIKRLRTALTPANQSSLLQEIKSLSLHKYLSEVISACHEGLSKLKTPEEIAVGVEVTSALHQRFGAKDFTAFLGWYIGRGLSSPDKAYLRSLTAEMKDKEERERISRQRILLRVATDLWLVGVLKSLDDVARPEEVGKVKEVGKAAEQAKNSKVMNGSEQDDAEPLPLEALKDLLGSDKEHGNLPLAVMFVKAFAWDILGIIPTRNDDRAAVIGEETFGFEEEEATPHPDINPGDNNETPIIDTSLQQRFRNILVRYFDSLKEHLIRDQRQLDSQGRRNAEAYVKSGEVFEDRQTNYEKQAKALEKLVANTQVLATALEMDMPDLSQKVVTTVSGNGGIGLVNLSEAFKGTSDGSGIWEDDDERRFYENIIDLAERVPSLLLEEVKKKKNEDQIDVKKAEEVKPAAQSKESEVGTANMAESQADDLSTSIANKTVGAQVDVMLAKLPELLTREQTDQFCVDFCFLNSKASRNRLVKALQDIPKGRLDLLSLYSRIIATLGKYMSDISQSMITYLDEEFKSLQRRKSKEALGPVRAVNIRYIAELTKFGVVPEHVIFHTLKVCLDDFTRQNIDIVANLLENCGRYLLRTSDSNVRMMSFLETLQRKKAAQHLSQQERMLIDNAIYHVNPPERAAIQRKERTALDLYVRKLIYLDLSKKNIEKITKQIRKLHWEEPEVTIILHKIFTKPAKIKYSNVYFLAVILGALHKYHQDFTVSVMDDLLEKITAGLEENDFKQNQKRIAEAKYLGELYVYRMIDATLILDTLHKLVSFGHPSGYARPDVICQNDLPDDFFRIRLACTLLEACGTYFDKGILRKKMDFFLISLQYYIQTKDTPPMDIDFLIQDTFGVLRPQWKLISSLDEATQKLADACKLNYDNPTKENEVEETEVSSGEDQEDEEKEDEEGDVEIRADHVSSSENELEEHDEIKELDDFDDENITVIRPDNRRDVEADAEFDRELAKMIADTSDSRRSDRKQVFDVPLPIRKVMHDGTTSSSLSNDSENSTKPSVAPMMKFSLMSKRGNKSQTRSIDLPADSAFALAMNSQREAEKAEQQRIKNLVLNYEMGQKDDQNGVNNIDGPAHSQPRLERSSQHQVQNNNITRNNNRARKLQLSDVDWT